MSTRLTLIATLSIAALVVLVTPLAVSYAGHGSVEPWGPCMAGASAVAALGLTIAHSRRRDRSRLGFYLPVALMVFCAYVTAWMVVQRLA